MLQICFSLLVATALVQMVALSEHAHSSYDLLSSVAVIVTIHKADVYYQVTTSSALLLSIHISVSYEM